MRSPKQPWICATGATGLGLVIAVVLYHFGPPGVDRPAHLYQLWIFRHYGFTLWDNYWYLGRYSFVGYSLAFYPLAYIVGLGPTIILSIGLGIFFAVVALAHLVPHRLGLGAVFIAVIWPTELLTGAYPYILSQAFGALAISLVLTKWPSPADTRGGRGRFGIGSFARNLLLLVVLGLCFASSPLGLLFVELFLITRWLRQVIASQPEPRQRNFRSILLRLLGPVDLPLVMASLFSLLALLESRAFPSLEMYPFWWTDLAEIVVFSGLIYLTIPKGRFALVRISLAVYLLAALAAFLLKTELGANIARLSDLSLIGAPVVASLVWVDSDFKRRLTVVALVIFSGYWWSTLVTSAPTDPAAMTRSTGAYWSASEVWLTSHLGHGNRVELVDPSDHSGDYYLARGGIPLVRGWFRQADFPTNSLLYRSKLTANEYLAWLHETAVSYVVLPAPPYDFSSASEATLVGSLSHSGDCLHLRRSSGGVKIYSVCNPTTVMPGATGVKISRTEVSGSVSSPGSYPLSLHFSPYLVPSSGCISVAKAGLSTWQVPNSGHVSVRFQFSVGRMLAVFLSDPSSVCAS